MNHNFFFLMLNVLSVILNIVLLIVGDNALNYILLIVTAIGVLRYSMLILVELTPNNPMWKRYRFKTRAVQDCRPLVFNPLYPWWHSGSGEDENENEVVIIVAYLPVGEDLKRYWDDAFDIESESRETITFTDRFPKPEWML